MKTLAKKQQDVPWYSEEAGFFGEGYLREYQDKLTNKATTAEVDFVEKVLGQPGAKILDLACGHGRHTVELARRGYGMTGQDVNSYFLKEADKTAKRANVEVRWIKSDMREIPFEGEFDAVLNLFTSFGYLESDQEDQKVFHQVAKALKSGGKFIIDVINRDYMVRNYKEKDSQQLSDGSVVIDERKFDFVTGRNIERRIRKWKDGKQEKIDISLRMYTTPELIAMFQKAGLFFKKVYGSYNGKPLGFDSKRCILIAEKT